MGFWRWADGGGVRRWCMGMGGFDCEGVMVDGEGMGGDGVGEWC